MEHLEIGTKVVVMYPFYKSWWKTEGYVLSKEDDDAYVVIDKRGNKIYIQSGYLKIV